MKDPATGRAALNGEWAKMFPDPDSRAGAPHAGARRQQSNHLTCDFTAVIGS